MVSVSVNSPACVIRTERLTGRDLAGSEQIYHLMYMDGRRRAKHDRVTVSRSRNMLRPRRERLLQTPIRTYNRTEAMFTDDPLIGIKTTAHSEADLVDIRADDGVP